MRSYSAYANDLKENEGLFEINEDGTMLLCIGSHVEPGEENPYDVPVSVWQLVSANNDLIDIVYREAF